MKVFQNDIRVEDYLLLTSDDDVQMVSVECYYCTKIGQIKGMLDISPINLVFKPYSIAVCAENEILKETPTLL